MEHDLLRSSGYSAFAVMRNGFLGRRRGHGPTLGTFPLHLCRSLHKLPFYTAIDTSYTHGSQHGTCIQHSKAFWKSLSGKRGVCVFVSTECTLHKEADMKYTRKIMSSVGSLTELSDTDISTPSVCSEIKKYDIFFYIRHML